MPPKPTKFLVVHGGEFVEQHVVAHCAAQAAVLGKNEDGSWKTSPLKEYPPPLCKVFAELYGSLYPQDGQEDLPASFLEQVEKLTCSFNTEAERGADYHPVQKTPNSMQCGHGRSTFLRRAQESNKSHCPVSAFNSILLLPRGSTATSLLELGLEFRFHVAQNNLSFSLFPNNFCMFLEGPVQFRFHFRLRPLDPRPVGLHSTWNTWEDTWDSEEDLPC